ncbi:hypothetical protein ACLOJK_024240, partial [Asimina triloba]
MPDEWGKKLLLPLEKRTLDLCPIAPKKMKKAPNSIGSTGARSDLRKNGHAG